MRSAGAPGSVLRGSTRLSPPRLWRHGIQHVFAEAAEIPLCRRLARRWPSAIANPPACSPEVADVNVQRLLCLRLRHRRRLLSGTRPSRACRAWAKPSHCFCNRSISLIAAPTGLSGLARAQRPNWDSARTSHDRPPSPFHGPRTSRRRRQYHARVLTLIRPRSERSPTVRRTIGEDRSPGASEPEALIS